MRKLPTGPFLLVSFVGMGVWHLLHSAGPLPVLQVDQVQRGDLVSAITATGSLQASRSVDIEFDGQNYLNACM